jgi:S-adenosylmethionine hydrolase
MECAAVHTGESRDGTRFILPIQSDANTILFVGHPSLVACITDFGTSDYYAGALRGVLAGLLPRGSVVDVTHEIPPGDIRRAAVALWESQPAFPFRTVFLVVVDPGVGGARRPAAFRFAECDVVCPDNGVATLLMDAFPDFQAVEIDLRRFAGRPISNTFHGRDLFAPTAARLALGDEPGGVGAPIDEPVKIPLPRLKGDPRRGWEGEILYRDHFGNAVTSIGRISYDLSTLEPWLQTGAQSGSIREGARLILEDGSSIPLARTYADAEGGPGTIALAGSNGLLEIAAAKYSPADVPALRPGAAVRLAVSG